MSVEVTLSAEMVENLWAVGVRPEPRWRSPDPLPGGEVPKNPSQLWTFGSSVSIFGLGPSEKSRTHPWSVCVPLCVVCKETKY